MARGFTHPRGFGELAAGWFRVGFAGFATDGLEAFVAAVGGFAIGGRLWGSSATIAAEASSCHCFASLFSNSDLRAAEVNQDFGAEHMSISSEDKGRAVEFNSKSVMLVVSYLSFQAADKVGKTDEKTNSKILKFATAEAKTASTAASSDNKLRVLGSSSAEEVNSSATIEVGVTERSVLEQVLA